MIISEIKYDIKSLEFENFVKCNFKTIKEAIHFIFDNLDRNTVWEVIEHNLVVCSYAQICIVHNRRIYCYVDEKWLYPNHFFIPKLSKN